MHWCILVCVSTVIVFSFILLILALSLSLALKLYVVRFFMFDLNSLSPYYCLLGLVFRCQHLHYSLLGEGEWGETVSYVIRLGSTTLVF